MILNLPSIVKLFLGGLGALLGILTAIVGLRAWLGWRKAKTASERDALEERSHLLALLLGVLALVFGLGSVFLYVVLASYVDDLYPFGVMCSFGVTRVQPQLVLALQLLEPAVLWGLGLWLLLALVDRRTKTAPLLGARLFGAIPAGVLALATSVVQIAYILSEKVGKPITCCSLLRTPSEATRAAELSGVLFLPAAAGSLRLFALANLVTIALALLVARRGIGRGRWSLLGAVGLAALGGSNLIQTHDAWAAELAPALLGLPHHHCLYELAARTPALSLAALLAVTGNSALLWPLALEAARDRAPEAVRGIQMSLSGLVALMLASELLLVGIHLL